MYPERILPMLRKLLSFVFCILLLALFNTAGAAALLIFCLLYTPCVAAIASIKRELGGKWAIGVVIFQCVIAWVAAFIVHGIVCLF